MNSSRLRRLAATVAVSVAAAVGVSTVGAGAASAATGTDLASQVTADHIPYSVLSEAPDGTLDGVTLAFPGGWAGGSQLTAATTTVFDSDNSLWPGGRFFLVPDGSVVGRSVSYPGPGITLTSARFYPTYRIMGFNIAAGNVDRNQRKFSNPMCLDAFGGAGVPGTAVGAYTCDPNADHQANQLWLRIPDPSTPNVYSFVNLDGYNRTQDVNTAPRLTVPDTWPDDQHATLQSPGSSGNPLLSPIQRFTETDYPQTNLATG